MFALEAEMTEPVTRWMQEQDMYVRAEFASGWGICDLVGCEFDQEKINIRTKNRQRQPLGSGEALHVYSVLPDKDLAMRGIGTDTLLRRLGPYSEINQVEKALAHLVSTRHAIETPHGAYFKQNGWKPLAKRLVAIELKLNRWPEVIHQAKLNRGFAPESYVALPMDRAVRATTTRQVEDAKRHGLGVIGVSKSGCEILLPADKNHGSLREALAMWVTEGFWRRYRGKH